MQRVVWCQCCRWARSPAAARCHAASPVRPAVTSGRSAVAHLVIMVVDVPLPTSWGRQRDIHGWRAGPASPRAASGAAPAPLAAPATRQAAPAIGPAPGCTGIHTRRRCPSGPASSPSAPGPSRESPAPLHPPRHSGVRAPGDHGRGCPAGYTRRYPAGHPRPATPARPGPASPSAASPAPPAPPAPAANTPARSGQRAEGWMYRKQHSVVGNVTSTSSAAGRDGERRVVWCQYCRWARWERYRRSAGVGQGVDGVAADGLGLEMRCYPAGDGGRVSGATAEAVRVGADEVVDLVLGD